MAQAAYSITLRHEGENVAVLRMEPGCEAVTVGRSRQSGLRTPESDVSVSGTHARLYWKGGALWLADAESRNGVYCRGVRLAKPRKVADGDIFAIGNSSVLCERIGSGREKSAPRRHKLEGLNGDRTGRQYDIVAKEGEESFTIGLDPSNALCLADMLVSRRHATLTVKENGECWIKDLDSRNGTFVNGEALRGKERLLKDNDKISIAYFDFRFLDRSVTHTRFFLWLKILAVAATLCVMAVVYVTWVTASSTMDERLHLVRRQASACDFAAAQKTLGDARLARDADRYRAQLDALEVQLEVWKRTSDEWAEVRSLLREGSFQSARKLLDPLTSGAADAWAWNGTTAVEEKRNAEFCARALRWYYDAEDVLSDAGEGRQPEQQAERIRERAVPLAEFTAAASERFAALPYLSVLKDQLVKSQDRMERIHEGFARVDECIAKLDAINPNFAQLTNQLQAVIRDPEQHAAVRSYAEKYKAPCAELAEARAFIFAEFKDIYALRFKDVLGKADQLKLPQKALCARHPRLSEHRMKLEGHHADAQQLSANLSSMVNGLEEKGVVDGQCGRALENVLNTASWSKALSFDCFGGKPPTTRRKEPSCPYDELLGIDYTFQSLRALPENYNGMCLRMIGFSPDVVEARKTFEGLDVFVKYVSDRPPWLCKGKLGALHAFCRELQAKRGKLIAFLSGFKGSDRAEIVAGFYAGYFSDDFGIARRKALADRFRTLQRAVNQLGEKYAAQSDPVEQIALRKKILDTGIPGDAQLHSKWVQKYEGDHR